MRTPPLATALSFGSSTETWQPHVQPWKPFDTPNLKPARRRLDTSDALMTLNLTWRIPTDEKFINNAGNSHVENLPSMVEEDLDRFHSG